MTKEINNETLKDLNEMISEAKALEAEAKAIMEQVDALKELVKEILTAAGLDKVKTADYSISYSTAQRTTVDKKSLQLNFPDIFGKVTKVSSYKVLRIS